MEVGTVFGLGRRKSHGQLVRAELGEGLGHLRQAATHAAGGVGAAMGPRVDTARRYVAPAATRVRNTAAGGWESTMTAVAPLAVAAADGARRAGAARRRVGSKRPGPGRGRRAALSGRRWSTLVGLLSAGAVVGALGAIAIRRRRRVEWDSYDPAPLGTLPAEALPVLARSATDADHKLGKEWSSAAADGAKQATTT